MTESYFHEVKTQEQARSYLLELVSKVVEARRQVDTLSSLHMNPPPDVMRNAWDNLNIRYGQALGALTTLVHCRVMDDVAYMELRQQVLDSKKPRLLGTVIA